MRVIFLNRFYWPDEPATAQLLTDLAESLVRTGHTVKVITSRPSDSAVPPVDTHHDVRILRVCGTRWGRRSLLGRAVDFTTFLLVALTRLILTARRGDIVVALTDPPLLGTFAWPVARLRGARVIHWVQDVYPEIAIAVGGHHWLRLIRPLRNLAWRRADHCIALDEGMASVLQAAGVRSAYLSIIPNWAPAGLGPPPPADVKALKDAWGLSGQFVAAYSGNLGRVHDLGPLLEVATILRDEHGITFVFVGDGAQRAALSTEATRRGLTHVQFIPAQPRQQLAASLAVGDVHFVTVRPGCENLVFPSKLYGIAAVGRPMIFVGPKDSTLAALVIRRGLGAAFSREETTQIAATLCSLRDDAAFSSRASQGAFAFAQENGGCARASSQWVGLFLRLTPTPATMTEMPPKRSRRT